MWTVTEGSPEHQQILDFITYGTGMELPLGSVSTTITGPGGLKEERTGSAMGLTLHPLTDPKAPPQIRCLLFDPQGALISEVVMGLQSLTRGLGLRPQDPVGMQATYVDEHEVIWLVRRKLEGQDHWSSNLTLRPRSEQHLAVDVLPAIRLLAGAHAPNRVLLAPRRGPYDADAAE